MLANDADCRQAREAIGDLVKRGFGSHRQTSKDNAKPAGMPSQGGSAGSNPVGATSLKPGLTRQCADPNTSIAYPVLASRAYQGRTKSTIICSLLRPHAGS